MQAKKFRYDDFCESCRRVLSQDGPILYVEEQSGRYFCSQECIKDYYDPVAEQFYRQQMLLRDRHDIAEARFAEYEKYVPLCLENPDEIWRDQTPRSDYVFYFIAAFSDEGGKFHYIVACYCIGNEPTFILLTTPTRDENLVSCFRKGQRVVRESDDNGDVSLSPVETLSASETHGGEENYENRGHALEEEMLRYRKKKDIPRAEFDDYNHLLEDTIENATEAWEMEGENDSRLLTLISHHDDGVYFVVLCILDEGSEEGDSWHVVYCFPTRDIDLVKHYRRGEPTEGFNEKYEFVH